MTCSILDRHKIALRKKNLTNANLEAPLEKEGALVSHINQITKEAKDKYNVNLGKIFNLTKNSSRIKLEPNIAAIEAIERSPKYELEMVNDDINKNLAVRDREPVVVMPTMESVGTTVNADGFPDLNLTC